jgi:hypothetical protein
MVVVKQASRTRRCGSEGAELSRKMRAGENGRDNGTFYRAGGGGRRPVEGEKRPAAVGIQMVTVFRERKQDDTGLM